MKKGKATVGSVLWIILFSCGISAQDTDVRFATIADVTADSIKKRVTAKTCTNPMSYVPDTLHPELSPFREIRINIHIIQDANGKNNFSEKDGTKWAKDLVEMANARLSENHKMFLPHGNTNPAYPIPFRYILTGDPSLPGDDGIYFHKNDTLYCMNKKARGKMPVNNVYDNRQYERYGIQKTEVINIFLIEHHPDSLKSATYKSSHDGIGRGEYAKLVGEYAISKHFSVNDKGDTTRFSPWDAAALFNHELGHCLGLNHSWNTDDGCEDTPKNPGCWNFNEPNGCQDVSNNVMDYNAFQHAYSPCQIGKISVNFFNDKNSRRFIKPSWCTYDGSKSITIGKGETIEWHGSVDLQGDLIIENNATLIAHCSVSLPPGGKVILMTKATLILDGAILTSRCPESFEGIELNISKKSKPQIFMKNGAIVQNVKHPL